MKKLFGNHRSLRILAMLLCVAMIAGVIGMQTQRASAAPGGYPFGGNTNRIKVWFMYSTDKNHMHGHTNEYRYYNVGTQVEEITGVTCLVYKHKDEHVFMGWYVSEEPDAEKYDFSHVLTGLEELIQTVNGEKVLYLYGRWCKTHTNQKTESTDFKAPTCTKPGSHKETTYCVDCGKKMSEKTVEDPALGHITEIEDGAWEETVWTTTATCTVKGEGTYYIHCGRCNEVVYSNPVSEEMKEHTPGAWEVVDGSYTTGTCIKNGTHQETQKCTVCEEVIGTKTVTDDLGDHKYGDPYKDENTVKEATCDKDGGYWLVKKCELCNDVQKVEYITLPKHHTEGETETVTVEPATCTKDGSEKDVTYCAACGEVIKESELRTINKLGHTPGDAVSENYTDSTCAETGSYDLVVYCTVCEKELSRETKTIELKKHTAGDPVEENRVEATCEHAGSYDEVVYCTECGKELSRDTKKIEMKKHTAGDPVEENRVEATCEKDGSYDSVIYCTECKGEISRTTITIPATDHEAGAAVIEKVVAATCTVDGSYDSVIYCKECKDEISRETITVKAQGHQPKAAVKENIKNSTCTATGSYDSVVYCEVCGLELSRDTVVIAKKAHEPGEVEILNRVDPTFTAEGSYNKVVKCKHCGETLSSDKVTIEKLTAEVTGISISGLDDAKKDYIVNDKINVDKIFVVYTLSDGTERKIPVTESMVTGFDSSKPAESLTLTVSVEGAKGTYNVAVNPTPVYTVEGDSTWDGVNDMFLTVHRSYNDAITYSLHVNLLNGKVVDVTNYDAASGSLKLALHKDYLKSLGEGKHTIAINFKDGFATVDVVIPNFEEPKNEEPKQEEPAKSETEVIPVEDNKTAVDNTKVEEKKADEKADSPKTADTSDIATWFILLILAMAAASVAMYCNKKRSSRA